MHTPIARGFCAAAAQRPGSRARVRTAPRCCRASHTRAAERSEEHRGSRPNRIPIGVSLRGVLLCALVAARGLAAFPGPAGGGACRCRRSGRSGARLHAKFFAPTALELGLEFPEGVPARTVTGLFRRHLLLLVKEALHNVAKHAAATRVEMRLTLESDNLELRIADDGRGFPMDGESRWGTGLANMRQRATELNGTFDLHSTPGKGTTIRVLVPLPAE